MAKNSFNSISLSGNVLSVNGTGYPLDASETPSSSVTPSSFNGISCTDNGNGSCTLVVNGVQITVSGEEYAPTPVVNPYLTFSKDTAFVMVNENGWKSWDGILEYSTDGQTWTEWDPTETVAINSSTEGDTKYLYLRGTGNTYLSDDDGSAPGPLSPYSLSNEEIEVYCSGNIEMLLDYQTAMTGNHPQMADYAFSNLFEKGRLLSAPELPAVSLTENCYGGMFRNCSGLITPPVLPATVLAIGCYSGMFENCISLATAPSLPATNLADSCYANMFNGCTSLETAPSLSATNLADSCYTRMFDHCTSLITAPALPVETLASNCYQGMFQGCTSLTTAPSLPATTLTTRCYNSMFSGCTSLTTIPSLPATTLANYCYQYMFRDCTSLTTAPSLSATVLADYCYQYMFYGCSSLTTAPSLPATSLVQGCYNAMFRGCSSLTAAPALPAETLVSNCYCEMFYNCTSLTTPVIMGSGTIQFTPALRCCDSMYYGCTSLNIYTTSTNHIPFYKAMIYSTSSSSAYYRSTYRMFYNCKIDGATSTANYITAGTQLYYAEPAAQASGYSGNIIAGGTYFDMYSMYSDNIYIKFGSAPSSASDYNAYVNYNSPTTLQGNSSYSNQTDAYIWGRGAYIIGSGNQQALSGNLNYSTALHIALSSNVNITLKPMITDDPTPPTPEPYF